MKLLWIIHGYIPVLNAGAETYTHNLNKYLISMGHEVIVSVPQFHSTYVNKTQTIDGVQIVFNTIDIISEKVKWCDIVLTHLDYSLCTINYVRNYKPIVWVSHNTFYDNYEFVNNKSNVSIIFNTLKAKELCTFTNKSIVLRPPITVEKTTTDPIKNKYITLININDLKGGHILKRLALAMPDKEFLGVTGGYNEQIEQPSSVKVVPHTTNISEIYNVSRIIIMPSSYESFGMVGAEAIINEIPVIASPCFGLIENLEDAGIFVERENLEGWISAIKALDNEHYYKSKQQQCNNRACELKEINKSELYETMMFLLQRKHEFIHGF